MLLLGFCVFELFVGYLFCAGVCAWLVVCSWVFGVYYWCLCGYDVQVVVVIVVLRALF